MKKIAILFSFLAVFVGLTNAQDTLIWENFNDTFPTPMILDYPAATTNDSSWYNYDEDQMPDASGGNRPDGWFWTYPLSVADSTTYSSCFAANSWTNDGSMPSANWLISKCITITNAPTAFVSWRSATRQTPRYLDGYVVLVSTTDNDPDSFTDTLFTAAEMIGTPPAEASPIVGRYTSYSFSGGWIQGWDGSALVPSELEFDPTSDGDAGVNSALDSARWIGLLTLHTEDLADYQGQKIYIAFKHNSTDDNLLFLDDILVTETIDPTAPIASVEGINAFVGSVYPNPATDYVNVNFDAAQYHNVNVQMYNNSGQMIYTNVFTENHNRIDVSGMNTGVYYIKLVASEGSMVKKVIVTR